MNDQQQRSKAADEVFCPSCGTIIKRQAVICVHCGVAIREMFAPVPDSLPSGPFAAQHQPASPKNRRTAILLSVFLGYWSWIYTMRLDWWKFLIGIALQLHVLWWLGVLIQFPWDRVVRGLFLPLSSLASFMGGWLWPVIHTAVRSHEFYRSYRLRDGH